MIKLPQQLKQQGELVSTINEKNNCQAIITRSEKELKVSIT